MSNALGVLGISTLDWFELGWMVVCFAVTVQIWAALLKWIREDKYRREHHINGRLKIYYRGKIRLYSLGLTKAAMYVLLGVQAATIPPRDYTGPLSARERTIAHLVGITAPISITANAVLLAVMLILDDRDRKRMDDADKESKGVDVTQYIEDHTKTHPPEGGDDDDSSLIHSSGSDVGLPRETQSRRGWRHFHFRPRLWHADISPHDHSISEVQCSRDQHSGRHNGVFVRYAVAQSDS